MKPCTRIVALGTLALAALCGACTRDADVGNPPAARDVGDAQALPRAEPPPGDWLAYEDPERGVAFRYPADFGARYISAPDWPPMLQIVEGPFECTEAGVEIARAGRTERAEIDGRQYCVTRVSEGAAGSIYTSYAYAYELDGRVAILTFTARAVQCGNYDDPQKTECERERAEFDPDALADGVARTVERH